MIMLFSNNAQSTIAGSITDSQTTVNLQSGGGAQFPNPSVGTQYFRGTFTDAATGLETEIVYVTQRVGDTLTIVRGQEGTTPRAWTANDLFDNMMTKGTAEAFVQQEQAQAQVGNWATDVGSTNAYQCTLNPALAAHTQGMPIRLFVANTNSGASTFNPGPGAKNIRRRDGSALIGLEMLAGSVVTLVYNGTNYLLQQPAPATAAALVAGTDQQSFVTPQALTNASFAPVGSMMPYAGLSAPTGWVFCYGQEISRSTFATLFAALTRSATVTMTIASPCVVTWAGHGLNQGDIVSFETTGSLPTGLLIATNYYVGNVIDPNTFNLSLSQADINTATYINTTGSQSGVQTCRLNPFGCGNGTTTFNVPDARDSVLAGWTAMGGSSRNLLNNNPSSGGFITAAMGNFAGAKDHTQIEAELVAHTHAAPEGSGSTANSDGGSVRGVNDVSVTGSTGGGDPFNITQPTLLVNYLIKT